MRNASLVNLLKHLPTDYCSCKLGSFAFIKPVTYKYYEVHVPI